MREAANEDDEALPRVAEGDERAFSLLVARHLERVRRIAYGFSGNRADADEIAQDVMMTVWTKAGNWTAGEARFSTWLHRVTVNRCIDHGRKRKLMRWTGLEAISGWLAGDDDPERTVHDRFALDRTRAIIAALPDRQRLALLLSVEEGLSTEAIAQTLGVGTGAAEQLLVRARKALRQARAVKETENADPGSGRSGNEVKE